MIFSPAERKKKMVLVVVEETAMDMVVKDESGCVVYDEMMKAEGRGSEKERESEREWRSSNREKRERGLFFLELHVA
jgi:hypothetical protein